MIGLSQGIQETLAKFSHYKPIWELNREETLVQFLKGTPLLGEFEHEIKCYEELDIQIDGEPKAYNVGPVAITTGIV